MKYTRVTLATIVMTVAGLAGSATTASAIPTAANVAVRIGVASGSDVARQPPTIPTGATVSVTGLNFVAGLLLDSAGPDAAAVKVQFTLSPGLHWGADGPDLDEACTASEQTTCETTVPGDGVTTGWGWNVTAEKAGTYTLSAQILESSTPDPDASNNTTLVTVNVTEAVVVSAGAVKLTPAKPKAGSFVVASAAVRADGDPVKPSKVVCTGTLAGKKLVGKGATALGKASCRYATPKSAKGKTLAGSMVITAKGKKITKRFSTTLR